METRRKKRLFVPDSAAILPFGHNAAGVAYFSNYFRQEFDEVYPLVCKALPLEVDCVDAAARQMPYLYTRNMVKDLFPPVKGISSLDPVDSVLLRYTRKYIHKYAKHDIFESIITDFYRRLFDEHQIGGDDYFFFHSAAFYCVIGLLSVLKNRPLNEWPNIHFRFINVLEGANIDRSGYRKIVHFLHRLQKKHPDIGTKISISSETPRYSNKLTRDTGIKATVVPYPPIEVKARQENGGQLIVSALGAAREDKGFYRLSSIIRTFISKYNNANVRFVIQSIDLQSIAGDHEKMHYVSQLLANPFVELLDHTLSKEELEQQHQRADILILPYDSNVYKLRGSAILMEALANQRSVVASAGCGFSEFVDLFKNGIVCKTDEEFADAVHKLTSKDEQAMRKELAEAKQLHEEYYKQSIQGIWS